MKTEKYFYLSVEQLKMKLSQQEEKRELLVNKVSGYDLRIREIKGIIKNRLSKH